MWEIFLLFALIAEFVTFFSSWLSLLSSVFIPTVLWLFFFYVTCLSSVWFLSEWVGFGLRLESLRNMGKWSDKWFKSSRYTGERYWIKPDCKKQSSDATNKSTVLCFLFSIHVVCPWRSTLILPLRIFSFAVIQRSNNCWNSSYFLLR